MTAARCVRLAIVAGLVLLAGCAHRAAPSPDRVGRIYSYVRSNSDGSEAERVHVYRASATHIEVTKMREKCTNAAFVTADLDLAKGQAVRLTGGRLRPNAAHVDFALLTCDPAGRRIHASVTRRGRSSPRVGRRPRRALAFVRFRSRQPDDHRPVPASTAREFQLRSAARSGWARIRTTSSAISAAPTPASSARSVGRAAALRFEVGGPAFAGKGGPLWLDAREGHVLAARWGIPNHAEYRDFALRLTGISDGGAESWRRLLAAHFEDCPA